MCQQRADLGSQTLISDKLQQKTEPGESDTYFRQVSTEGRAIGSDTVMRETK